MEGIHGNDSTNKLGMKISIVIPIYNTAQYLPETLGGITAQTCADLQIICVNDGSTDGSAEILEQWAARDARIELVHQPNAGIAAARNAGLKRVKGEYLAFLDSDDWMDEDTLQKAAAAMREHRVDIVFWGYVKEYGHKSQPVRVWENDRLFSPADMPALVSRLIGPVGEYLRRPEQQDSIGTVWGKLYKSELFFNNGVEYTDTKIIGSAEDVLVNIDVFSYARSAYYCSDLFHHYRKDNAASFTRVCKENLTGQWVNLFREMNRLVVKHRMGEEAAQALSNRKALSLLYLGLNLLGSDKNPAEKYSQIKALLREPWLRESLEKLPLTYFPLHWRAFYSSAKFKFTPGVFALLLIIRRILSQ